MNYTQAQKEVSGGMEARRDAWLLSRKIRLAIMSDADYLNYDAPIGTVVSDCREQKCDCIVCLYHPTPEDLLAEDWQLVKK